MGTVNLRKPGAPLGTRVLHHRALPTAEVAFLGKSKEALILCSDPTAPALGAGGGPCARCRPRATAGGTLHSFGHADPGGHTFEGILKRDRDRNADIVPLLCCRTPATRGGPKTTPKEAAE